MAEMRLSSMLRAFPLRSSLFGDLPRRVQGSIPETMFLPRATIPALALLVAACAAPVPGPDARPPLPQGVEYDGGLVLESEDDRFGGLSDLRFDGGPARLIAVTDQGHWVRLTVPRDPAGAPTRLAAAEITPFRAPDGRVLEDKAADAESLAPRPGGGWLVGLERDHRLAPFGPDLAPDGPPLTLPGLDKAPINQGIEALDRLPDGRLLALAEALPEDSPVTAGWLGRPGDWRAVLYRPAPD